MRFQVDAGMLRAFHRQTGDVDLAAVSADVVATFLQPRHQVTSTWRMKHRALRRFYQHWIARGLVTRSPVPTAVPPVADTFVPHIYTDEELQRLLHGVETHQARVGCTIAAPTFGPSSCSCTARACVSAKRWAYSGTTSICGTGWS